MKNSTEKNFSPNKHYNVTVCYFHPKSNVSFLIINGIFLTKMGGSDCSVNIVYILCQLLEGGMDGMQQMIPIVDEGGGGG